MKKRLLALILAMVCSPAFATGYSFTSNNPMTTAGNNTFSSFTSGSNIGTFSSPSSGTILFVEGVLSQSVTLSNISDSACASWTIVSGASDGVWKGWGAYCYSTGYSGNDYVYFTLSASSTGAIFTTGELQGGPSSSLLGASNGSTGSSAAPSTTLASLSSGSAIVALNINAANSQPTQGSGFTKAFSSSNGTYGYGAEYLLSSSSGSVPANFTISTGTWNVIAMAFNPIGGSPVIIQGGFALSPSN